MKAVIMLLEAIEDMGKTKLTQDWNIGRRAEEDRIKLEKQRELREIRGQDLQQKVRNLLRHLATYETDSHFKHSILSADKDGILDVLNALECEVEENLDI